MDGWMSNHFWVYATTSFLDGISEHVAQVNAYWQFIEST